MVKIHVRVVKVYRLTMFSLVTSTILIGGSQNNNKGCARLQDEYPFLLTFASLLQQPSFMFVSKVLIFGNFFIPEGWALKMASKRYKHQSGR